MPSHVIPLAPLSLPTRSHGTDNQSPSWTAAAPSTPTSTPGGRLGNDSFLASLTQSSSLTWFTCGLTALVGPRARRGITQAQQAETNPGASSSSVAVVDTEPAHTVDTPTPDWSLPVVTAPAPAITIDTSSPPGHAYSPQLPSFSAPYDIPIPGTQPAPPAPTTRKPSTSSRWTSLSRLFQSLSAIRLASSRSRSTPSSHLTIPTHFHGRRDRSHSLRRSPTASSFTHSSFSSTTTSTPPPNTPPVKPHAMLLPDSPLDREYTQWCAARDTRTWIVAALAEIGVDPHAPAGVSGMMEMEFGGVPPASPLSTQSFHSASSTRGAALTIAEGLVQCVIVGGVQIDVASATAAPVDALRAVVARFAGLVVENTSADPVHPVGFVADREVQACELPELAVVAVREVYHTLKALRSPPPLYSELADEPIR